MVTNRAKSTRVGVPELDGVSVGFETVTLATAMGWIAATEEADANFRKTNPGWVESIFRMMETGDWTLSPGPVVLSEEEHVLDGLHRLNAQVKAGMDRVWLVVRGWPASLDGGIDRGKLRNVQQWLTRHHRDWPVSNRAVATVRAAVLGLRVKQFSLRMTDRDFERAFKSCIPLLRLTEAGMKNGAGLTGGVRGAFLRAGHYCEQEDLIAAMQIVSKGSRDGIQQERDKSIVALRTYLTQRRFRTTFVHYEEYVKAESALVAFLNGKALKSLRGIETEQFPVELFDSLLNDHSTEA